MAKRGAKNATALRSVQVKRKTSNRDASAHRSVKGSAAQKANLASDSRMVSSKKLEKKTAKTEKAEKAKAQKSNTKKHTLKKQATRTKLADSRSKTVKPGEAVRPSARNPRLLKGATASSRSGKSGVYIEQAGEWQVIDIDDGVALHDPGFKTVHYLNHIAAAVFLLCKQSIAITTVSAIIQEQYELDASPEAAIRKTVNEMIRAGLLKASKRLS